MRHSIIQSRLSSGAKLIQVKIPSYDVSLISAWFQAGSFSDPIGKEGLAHFFEHLFMTKTAKYPDRIERLKIIETLGIDFNAFTGKDFVEYHFECPEKNFFKSLDVLIDGLNNSLILEKDIEQEKKIILNERANNVNDPWLLLNILRDKSLYGDSVSNKDFFGTNNSISAIKSFDFEKFKDSFYTTKNLCFVVISNKSHKSILKRIEESLFLPNKSAYKKNNKKDLKKIDICTIDNKKINESYIGINFDTTSIKNSKDRMLLNVLREYLANNWSSRLNQKLRIEKNSSYWVYSNTEYFSKNGYLGITYSTTKSKVFETIEAILNEISSIRNGQIEEQDFLAIKNKYVATIRRRILSPVDIAWWYGPEGVLGGKIIVPDVYINEVEKITKKDLVKITKKYLNQKNISVNIIGDHEKSFTNKIITLIKKSLIQYGL